MLGYKELLGIVAIALTFIAFIPYIRSIQAGQTQPHVFSWVIWGSTTFVVFLAQLADNGGAGAWSIGVSGLITLYIALLAYQKRGDIRITSTDRLFLIAALASLPLWYVTANPVWAVLILTTIDLFGFAPTFRKAYHQPYGEHLGFYSIMVLRNVIALLALQHVSLTTSLFPAATGILCVSFIMMVKIQRHRLASL